MGIHSILIQIPLQIFYLPGNLFLSDLEEILHILPSSLATLFFNENSGNQRKTLQGSCVMIL